MLNCDTNKVAIVYNLQNLGIIRNQVAIPHTYVVPSQLFINLPTDEHYCLFKI